MLGVIGIIISLLNIYSFIIIIRSILTWFPDIDRSNPIVKFIFQVTEPVLQPIREALPQSGGIDFSPMVVIVIIWVLTGVLAGL